MGKLYGAGINQADLVDLLVTLKTKTAGLLAKLDLDATLTDADFASLHALTIPASIQTTGAKGIRDQGALLAFLQTYLTNWAALLAKIDADLGDTDYVTDHGVADTIENPGTGTLHSAGVYQGAVVNLLNKIVTKFNALLAALDADDGVADTNYVALWAITDTVVEAGTRV